MIDDIPGAELIQIILATLLDPVTGIMFAMFGTAEVETSVCSRSKCRQGLLNI